MPNLLSILINSCQQITDGQAIGYHSPPIGRRCPRNAYFHRKRVRILRRRSRPYHPTSGISLSCVTLKDGLQWKSAAFSEYPRSISGCFSTALDQRCGTYLRSTFRKSRLRKIFRNWKKGAFGNRKPRTISHRHLQDVTHRLACNESACSKTR